MDTSEIKYKLNHASHHEKPAHALMLSLCYRDNDSELSVKYASLAVEMIDSLDPSDLVGPFKDFIAEHREFARHVYTNIVNDKYKSDEEYQHILNTYWAEQSIGENKMSEAAATERKKNHKLFL